MPEHAPPAAPVAQIQSSHALELAGSALISHEHIANRIHLMIGIRPLPDGVARGLPQVHALIEADNHYDDPDGPLIVVGLGMDRTGLNAVIASLTAARDGWTQDGAA